MAQEGVECGRGEDVTFSCGAGHVGALFASIPRGVVGGVFCVILASTTALGLSSLRYTEMGSSRNLLVVGVALFLGLSVPDYVATYSASVGHGPMNSPSEGVSGEGSGQALTCLPLTS